jgi:hypothetical protein
MTLCISFIYDLAIYVIFLFLGSTTHNLYMERYYAQNRMNCIPVVVGIPYTLYLSCKWSYQDNLTTTKATKLHFTYFVGVHSIHGIA